MHEIELKYDDYRSNMQSMRRWCREVLELKWTDVYARGFSSGEMVTIKFDRKSNFLAFKMVWGHIIH